MGSRTCLALVAGIGSLFVACASSDDQAAGRVDAGVVAARDASASSAGNSGGGTVGTSSADAGGGGTGGNGGGSVDGGGGASGDGGGRAADDAGGATGFGVLADGTRDKTLWPFAATSIWNTPIGSGASYAPAGITKNDSGGYTTFFHPDEDVIVMTPTAPSLEVDYNAAAWTGANRCPTGGKVLANVPVPASYTLANSGANNSAAFLAADGTTVQQNQPFTRCTAGGAATALVAFANTDITGAGITGAHGGSGLSALGGTIRKGELTAGQIRHALKVELWAKQYYHCCSPIWPAVVVDGDATGTTYGGSNAHLGPGALLALLPSFDATKLTTAPAKIIAAALRDYGAYVVDDVASNGWGLCFEQGPAGRVADEVQSLYGVSLTPGANDPFMTDIVAIFEALQIVTNNAASAVGGGGTPRVSLAPAIGN